MLLPVSLWLLSYPLCVLAQVTGLRPDQALHPLGTSCRFQCPQSALVDVHGNQSALLYAPHSEMLSVQTCGWHAACCAPCL